MASILSRLFGPDNQQVGPAKAAIGPGVVALMNDVPLSSISRNPQKMEREAQAVYHNNAWAYVAENTVSGVGATVTWHVEDERGKNVTDTHPAVAPLRKPSPNQKARPMRQLTLRHGGMCGHAFWYKDAPDGDGVPAGFYYINPARMWEATDPAGNLIGWIMDADRTGGRQPVPFSLDEILHFVYDPDDSGHRGVGIIQAAFRRLQLSEAANIHAEKSLRAGGRKPGIIMPGGGSTFSEDQYQQIVRELRQVTDSPDAAKKSLIFKAPVDYKDAGVDPKNMEISALLTSGRDDTLALWKVPPSQIGITQARGLNSGETMGYEEAALWQNAIEPRLDMYRETLQEDYLDAFGLKLVLNTPSFDDQLPLYNLAEKAKVVPITNDERRALVGLPPLGPEAGGNLVFLDRTLVALGMEAPDAVDSDIEAGGEVKAKLHFEQLHDKLTGSYVPRLQRAVGEALAEQKADIARRIERSYAHLAGKPTDTQPWWDEGREYTRLEQAIQPFLADLAREVGTKTGATFFRPAKADSFIDRVIDYVRARAGERIAGINKHTRDEVRLAVEEGISAGLSPAQIATSIETHFDSSRAERIARTETGYALNDTAIGTYRTFDVEQVEVIDGDEDDICAPVNGATWTLDQASSNPLGHPNCTRDFIPIVS